MSSQPFAARSLVIHYFVARFWSQVLVLLSLTTLAANSHAFSPGCTPPSVPNFGSGNQIALNVAMPQALNFGLTTRPIGCTTPYSAVRLKVSTSLPPGITEVLNAGATSVGFSGTPTALGTFTAIIEVTENGTTWADGLRVVFDVDACMHWNGSRNQRFQVALPSTSSNGDPFVDFPLPTAGSAYTPTTRAVIATPPNAYPAATYCAPASYVLSGFGGGTMSVAAASPAPLAFTVSGTPTGAPSQDPEGCLSNPDAGSDADIRVRNSNGEDIGSLDVCFGASNPGVLTIGGNPPNGTVGIPYATSLTTNAPPSSTFSLLSGSLPPGLTLAGDGTITGTPTTTGTYNFTAQVAATIPGVGPQTASSAFSITINAVPTQSSSAAPVPTLGHAALGLLALLIAGVGLLARRSIGA